MQKLRSFNFNNKLWEKIKRLVKENHVKYRSITQFIELAVKEKLEREEESDSQVQ